MTLSMCRWGHWRIWTSPPGHLKVGLNATVSGQTKDYRRLDYARGAGPETLIPGTQDAEMGDIGTGLYKLILYPAVGAEAGYEPEAGTVVGSIDNLKIWEPAAVKPPQDFGWRDAYLTRDGEKVDMAAGEFVPGICHAERHRGGKRRGAHCGGIQQWGIV